MGQKRITLLHQEARDITGTYSRWREERIGNRSEEHKRTQVAKDDGRSRGNRVNGDDLTSRGLPNLSGREEAETETDIRNGDPRYQGLNVVLDNLTKGGIVAVRLYRLIQPIVDMTIVGLTELDRILNTGSETVKRILEL